MASKTQLTQPSTTEIIPSSQLPESQFKGSLVVLEGLEQDLIPISDEARALKIESKSDFIRAGELIAKLKEVDKTNDETMAPYKSILKKVSDFIQTRKNRVANKIEETKGVLTPKMAEWTRKEEAERQAEQARQRAIETARLKREAEEKRRLDEEAAKQRRDAELAKIQADLKAGEVGKREAERLKKEAEAQASIDKQKAKEAADLAKQNAAKQAQSLKVESNIPSVAGNVKRTNYKAECTNPQGYIKSLCEAYKKGDHATFDRLVVMIEVSNERLGSEARNTKSNIEMERWFPFVRAWSEQTF